MLREAIIFNGVATCLLDHKSRVKLLKRRNEIMKEAIPQLPQTYQTFIPRVVKSCMHKLTPKDWKQIGKAARRLKLNFYTEEQLKEKSQQVINYMEAKIEKEKEWIDKMIIMRPMNETKEEPKEEQEKSNLAKIYKSMNQERKKEGWRKYYNMKKKCQILEMLQESKEKALIKNKLEEKMLEECRLLKILEEEKKRNWGKEITRKIKGRKKTQ